MPSCSTGSAGRTPGGSPTSACCARTPFSRTRTSSPARTWSSSGGPAPESPIARSRTCISRMRCSRCAPFWTRVCRSVWAPTSPAARVHPSWTAAVTRSPRPAPSRMASIRHSTPPVAGVPASRIDFRTALWLATAGGAGALGLPVGRFEPGCDFDAMLVDTRRTDSNLIVWVDAGRP